MCPKCNILKIPHSPCRLKCNFKMPDLIGLIADLFIKNYTDICIFSKKSLNFKVILLIILEGVGRNSPLSKIGDKNSKFWGYY